MSLVVENDAPLPLTVTERDLVAVEKAEDDIPTLESCAVIHAKQEAFTKALDWTGAGKDTERQIESPRQDK